VPPDVVEVDAAIVTALLSAVEIRMNCGANGLFVLLESGKERDAFEDNNWANAGNVDIIRIDKANRFTA
ncbi:MAG: hypothetical protein IT167_30030, partial [Bryobacterales bacterium]|nr:hypothetical protein [Bryobacterales bacterium]